MGIAAGRLDRRIVIERATYTQNAMGEQVPSWSTLATVSAEATPLSDGERIRAAEVSAEISMRFVIRWSPLVEDVNPKDRVSYGGRLWNLWGVKEIGRREGLELTAGARAE